MSAPEEQACTCGSPQCLLMATRLRHGISMQAPGRSPPSDRATAFVEVGRASRLDTLRDYCKLTASVPAGRQHRSGFPWYGAAGAAPFVAGRSQLGASLASCAECPSLNSMHKAGSCQQHRAAHAESPVGSKSLLAKCRERKSVQHYVVKARRHHIPECMISEFLLLVSVPIALADSRTRTSLSCDRIFARASPTTPAPISTVSTVVTDFEVVLSRLLACAVALFIFERAFLPVRVGSRHQSLGLSKVFHAHPPEAQSAVSSVLKY